jgi:hypothetical protein
VQSALPLVGGGAWNIVSTSITKAMGVEGAAAYVERVVEEIAVGRTGQPEHIGNAVVLLAPDVTSSGTGRELPVDGGQAEAASPQLGPQGNGGDAELATREVVEDRGAWADAAPGGRADPGTDRAPHPPCDPSAAGDDFNRP